MDSKESLELEELKLAVSDINCLELVRCQKTELEMWADWAQQHLESLRLVMERRASAD